MHFLNKEVEKFIKNDITHDEVMSNLGNMYHRAVIQVLNENMTNKDKIEQIETLTEELIKAKHRWYYR